MPILNVPYLPQWGDAANRYRNDCGPACIGMCLSYYGKLNGLMVDQLAAETGLRYSDSGLLPVQLSALATKHGLGATVRRGTTEDDLKAEIDAGRPVVALIAYRFILGRLDQADRVPGEDAHYLAVIGYDDTHFVLNDPDYWIPHVQEGHNYLCPVTELQRAMDEYRGQCVFIEETSMSLKEQIIALANQIEALAENIVEAPAWTPTHVTTAWLKVRVAPVDGAVITTLAPSTGVRVVEAESVAGWKKIDKPNVGFCSEVYLTPKV